jgi:hypothetical protein
MGFLVQLLRVLAVLFVVRLMLRAIAGFLRGRSSQDPAPKQAPGGAQGTELVRDRICNTFLPKARAVRAMIGGHEEHFCSTECRDRALLAASRAS